MRILLTNAACNMGGVETLMVSLSSALRARGHVCELFFFSRGPMEKYLPADCAAHFGDLADCLRLVGSRGFDVVHANSTDWHVGVSAVRGVGARLVLTSHGRTSPAWFSANCDALASCCGWEADEQQPFTDLAIRKVPNGIDTDRFHPGGESRPPGPPIVAWVGRGTDPVQKRLGLFAAIAPALRAAGLRLRLVEPYGPEAVDEVTPGLSRSLLPHVESWGAVSVSDMPAFYREVAASGGCVVSTSGFEGLPLTLLEAQACGCPVIGPDVRGVNECVLPEHGGVLYPDGLAPEALAALVIACVADAEAMRRRRRACAGLVRERFSLEGMALAYLRIYEEALAAPAARAGAIKAWLRLRRFGWAEYVEHYWTAGYHQHEAALRLAAGGEWRLASVAASAALATCPTLYLRPGRVALLLSARVRSALAPGSARAGGPAGAATSQDAAGALAAAGSVGERGEGG